MKSTQSIFVREFQKLTSEVHTWLLSQISLPLNDDTQQPPITTSAIIIPLTSPTLATSIQFTSALTNQQTTETPSVSMPTDRIVQSVTNKPPLVISNSTTQKVNISESITTKSSASTSISTFMFLATNLIFYLSIIFL